MIELLRIRELALVESLELELGPGLNVVTGETGAGKSIVLGALGLLAGARAQASAVRGGADEASVEALFRTAHLPELEKELEARGLAAEEGELVVRRTVHREGRSRAFVAGRLVPAGALAELFQGRLEVSSQHASQALLRPAVQGRLLDAYGDLLELRRRVEEGVRGLRARAEELARLRGDAAERARQEDVLRFQIEEIDAAALAPDETETLPAEHRRLVHAERLRREAEQAALRLAGDPAGAEAVGAADLLRRAAGSVEELAGLDPDLAPLAERLREAGETAGDVASELERYASRIEADPARLAEVEERLRVIDGLRRKYGETAQAILAFRERAEAERSRIGGGDARMRKLEEEAEAERRRVADAAAELSRGREQAARRLARAVEEECAGLALEGARFQVALEPAAPAEGAPCAPHGAESAELRFSANPGEALQPLRRVASGGELSRLFLALKNVLRQAGAGMVLVFDEVDAGVGGRVAERVGTLLAGLARHHQVLCITHLPQIAAHADRHFRVAKGGRGARAVTTVEALGEEARIEELARMAGGEEVREETRRHARALRRAARRRKPS